MGGLAVLLASASAQATPSRQWGTYYGGSSLETGLDVDFTSGFEIDVVGEALSSGIATVGSHDNQLSGASDAYLAQFDSAGGLVWATYYGGSATERFTSLVHDDDDNIYAFGDTTSTGFIATLGAHQTTRNGSSDAMLVKFDASGARVWGTYFGGNAAELGQSVCSDGSGTTFIVGHTRSNLGLSTTGAFRPNLGGLGDAFIAKFDSSGGLQWATYYGDPSGMTFAHGCAVDSFGSVYAVGSTSASSNIASAGAFDTALLAPEDAFLVKFNAGGARLWATYYGGTATTNGFAVAVDAADNVYMAGSTASSTGISTLGTTLNDGLDAFVVKFNSAGARQWGTYYGGSNGTGNPNGEEMFWNMDIAGGDLYLSGRTDSINSIATAGAWDSTNATGNLVGMFVMLTTAGAVTYGSYHGQSGDTMSPWRTGVAVSHQNLGRAAIIGETDSASGVATAGTHDTSYNTGVDAAITYIHLFDM